MSSKNSKSLHEIVAANIIKKLEEDTAPGKSRGMTTVRPLKSHTMPQRETAIKE